MSHVLSPRESNLCRAAMFSALRASIESTLDRHGGLVSAAARMKGRPVEEMANRALVSGAWDRFDPRVATMTSPVARAAVGLPVGLADGAERRLAERLPDPSEAARRAAEILAKAEQEASGADLAALRGGRLGLERLAEIGGPRAAAGLGTAAPLLERAGLLLAKKTPDLANEAFGLTCAFVEAERETRKRAAVRGDGEVR